MRTIIAPTDFSDISINAVNYAADMAMDIGAELVLLHVTEQPVAIPEVPFTGITYDEMISDETIKTLKQKLHERTENKISIHIKNTVGAIHGSIQYELEDLCKRKKPFAVVMGTHGNGIMQRFFVGSATFHAAAHLPYPVLVVPANVQYKPVRKIVLASDLKTTNTSLHELRTVINAFKATLHVVYVNKEFSEVEKLRDKKNLLENYLEEFSPEFHFIYNSSVQKGIEIFVEKNDIDLVLILPKKHWLFHKSQSKELIFHSSVPVATIHEE